jgi:hypothetical protein
VKGKRRTGGEAVAAGETHEFPPGFSRDIARRLPVEGVTRGVWRGQRGTPMRRLAGRGSGNRQENRARRRGSGQLNGCFHGLTAFARCQFAMKRRLKIIWVCLCSPAPLFVSDKYKLFKDKLLGSNVRHFCFFGMRPQRRLQDDAAYHVTSQIDHGATALECAGVKQIFPDLVVKAKKSSISNFETSR